ncbi:MAG TPA: hypothetical protein VL157_01470 [Gemmatimonadaceae bacterium]|nr:hypothetical protein [Gemmatimonadaceae bacterium]
MSDDKFDEFLQRAARSYHEPPATPREEMWTRIEAERRVRRLAVPTQRRRWWLTASALAATLLLGVALGTWMESGRETTGSRPPTVAMGPSTTPAPSATTPVAAAPAAPAARGGATGRAPAPNAAGSLTFDAAAADHLGRAEALLTTFNTESSHGTIDPQVGAWAGDLLTTTRLLLDSPRARDPRTRKLLSDLEVVLAQIAQLKSQSDSSSDELEIIEQAVRSQNMMTRLRDATPPGSAAPASGS